MKKDLAVCNTCTRKLIETAYSRSNLFRIVRELLKMFMHFWIEVRKIDLSDYIIRTPYCKNCNRFYKNALKNNSRIFVLLNNIINPVFDYYLEKKLGKEEIIEAKKKAQLFTKISDNKPDMLSVGEMSKWLKI